MPRSNQCSTVAKALRESSSHAALFSASDASLSRRLVARSFTQSRLSDSSCASFSAGSESASRKVTK